MMPILINIDGWTKIVEGIEDISNIKLKLGYTYKFTCTMVPTGKNEYVIKEQALCEIERPLKIGNKTA